MGAGDPNMCACSEQVYPSQMQHRCVALDGNEKVIVTPTEAQKNGYRILAYFPKADGSLSRR